MMKRDDLKALFLSRGPIVCLGPFVLNAHPLGNATLHATIAKKRKALVDAGEEALLNALSDDIAAIFNLPVGDKADPLNRSLKLVNARIGCGYVWNDFLANQPFDGVQRTTKCPQCKVELGWQHPVCDEDAELQRLDKERRLKALLEE